MTIEIEYSTPTPVSLGEWQVQMTEQMAADVPNQSPISSMQDIERESVGNTFVVRIPGSSTDSQTVSTIRNIVEGLLQNAAHVETRVV